MVSEKIPFGWKQSNVEDVCDFLDGMRKPVKKSDREKMRGNIPYYGASGVIDWVNDFIFNEPLICVGEDGENLRSRVLPMAFKINGKTWVNNHAHVLRPKQHADIDYLTYYLNSIDYEEYITGSAQPKLNQNVCRKISLLWPPLPEQRKIAAILSSVDDAIATTQRIIYQTEVVKRGLIQRLLTKGIGHTKFKKTDIGEIPDEWDIKTLEEVGTWSGGGTPSKIKSNYWTTADDGVLWVSPKDMTNVVIVDSQDKITEVGLSEKGLSLLPIGTILVVARSGILRNCVPIALAGRELTINQDLKALKVNQAFNHKYVFYTLKAFDEKIRNSCVKSGTTVESIDFPSLKSMQIPVPPRYEQDKIASLAEEFYTKQANEHLYLSELRRLKQGLMQVLLTGKIRVNVDSQSEVSI